MKKLLVVLLAMVMVFGLASNAFAATFTDTDDLNQTQQDAIEKLFALDIIEGDPGGTFRPTADISRAEFAKIACNLAGLGEAAENLAGTTSRFSDVSSGQWYTGWVNMATAQGFVNGYPDGTFKPNNNITFQEVITVLLRILGYDDNLTGPWPFNYVAQASRIDITKDVTFVATAQASRVDVAVMASETLSADIKYWDADKGLFLDPETNSTGGTYTKTLLAKSFDASVKEDARLGTWGVNNLSRGVYTLDVNGTATKFAESFYITGGNFINDVNNLIGDVYTNKDKEIIYVDVTGYKESHDKVNYAFKASSSVNGEIDSITIDGKKVSLIATVTSGSTTVSAPEFEDFILMNDTGVRATFFYNDDDEVYLVKYLPDFSEYTTTSGAQNRDRLTPVIVEAYNSSSQTITVLDGSASAPIVRNKDVVVIKDGKIATLEDLEKGDVFYKNDSITGIDQAIVVTSMKTGRLDSANATTSGNPNTIKIAGTNLRYDFDKTKFTDDDFDTIEEANSLVDGTKDDIFGTDISYITANGNPFLVVVISASESAGNTSNMYGIVVGGSRNLDNQMNSLVVLTQEGTTVTYTLVKSSGQSYPDWGTSLTNGDVSYGSLIEAKVSSDSRIETKNINLLTQGIYGNDDTFANDGTSSTYGTLYRDPNNAKVVGDNSGVSDVNNGRIQIAGTYYTVDSNAKIFNVKTNKPALNDFDEASVINVSTITSAKEVKNSAIIAKVVNNRIVAMAILNSGAASSSNYGVLTELNYSGKAYVELVGESGTYELENSIGSVELDTAVYNYEISGDKLDAVRKVVAVDGTTAKVNDAYLALVDGREWVTAGGSIDTANANTLFTVDSISRNTLRVTGSSDNWSVTNAKYFYVDSNNEFIQGYYSDIEVDTATVNGSKVVAITSDDPDDFIIDYVIIFPSTYTYVAL